MLFFPVIVNNAIIAVPYVEEQILPLSDDALIAVLSPLGTEMVEVSDIPIKQPINVNPSQKDLLQFIRETFGERLTPYFWQLMLCESNGMQFRNGKVVTNLNKNGTIDSGLFQINSSHDKDLTDLGLDYKNDWKDNVLAAKWVYDNKGGIKAWTCKKVL